MVRASSLDLAQRLGYAVGRDENSSHARGKSGMQQRRGRAVYSTDAPTRKRCPRCGRDPCRCPRPKSLPPSQQVARIQREKKGRRGKTVTVVRDLQLTPEDLAALAKELKAACACGGTVKEGQIEIQGDHRERVATELQKRGFKTRFVGG